MTKKIYIAADHAGYERKEMLKTYLEEKGYKLKDFGAHELDPQDDYPDFAHPLAVAVAKDDVPGIVLCGNAEGVCIVANKVKGVRAALGFNEYAAKSSREDDNSNVLCLPGRALSDDEARSIVEVWLETEFSNEKRHLRRLNKIKGIEEAL